MNSPRTGNSFSSLSFSLVFSFFEYKNNRSSGGGSFIETLQLKFALLTVKKKSKAELVKE